MGNPTAITKATVSTPNEIPTKTADSVERINATISADADKTHESPHTTSPDYHYSSIDTTKNIVRVNQSMKGLPNINTNMCYMLSTIHMLALTIDANNRKFEEMIDYIIEETKQCLTGKNDSTEAMTTAHNLWEYSRSRWPEYIRDNETSNQADAAEYLERLIQASPNIISQVATKVETQKSCTNQHCPLSDMKSIDTEYILRTREIPRTSEMDLQNIIDNHLLPTEYGECVICGNKSNAKSCVYKAPANLILQVSRRRRYGARITTNIRCPTGIVKIRESKGRNIPYKVAGVITHIGTEVNGHYISTYYMEGDRKWITIDNDEILHRDTQHTSGIDNKQGTIFFLKKVISQQGSNTSSSMTDKNPPGEHTAPKTVTINKDRDHYDVSKINYQKGPGFDETCYK